MKKFAGLLGALALVAFVPQAHADYLLSYQVNGGTVVNCANSADDTFASCFSTATNVGGGITITSFQGTSDSPGTTTESDQTGSVTKIQTTGSGTLTLYLAAQDFTMPIAPPGLSDLGSLTVISFAPGSGSVALTNCVDQSNGSVPPVPPGSTFCSAPAVTFNNPTINYSTIGSQSNNTTASISSLTAPYSLSEVVTITFNTASNIEVQTSQVLSTPEPASIALMGTLLVGIATLVRKKAVRRA